MTKIEVIKANKARYEDLTKKIDGMTGLEKRVAEVITLEWLKGNNWLGGLNGKKEEKLWNVLLSEGYTEEEIFDESGRQCMWYC